RVGQGATDMEEVADVYDKIIKFIEAQEIESDKLSVKQICEDLIDVVTEMKSDAIDYGEQQ
ncbi:MAG: hypothetical protein ABGW78_02460, partial [Pirellulales bacterium]